MLQDATSALDALSVELAHRRAVEVRGLVGRAYPTPYKTPCGSPKLHVLQLNSYR
jgi:hypothetical protein